jgi:hypothetical protein
MKLLKQIIETSSRRTAIFDNSYTVCLDRDTVRINFAGYQEIYDFVTIVSHENPAGGNFSEKMFREKCLLAANRFYLQVISESTVGISIPLMLANMNLNMQEYEKIMG